MIRKAVYSIFSIAIAFLATSNTKAMDVAQKDEFTQNEAYLKCVSKEQIKEMVGIDPTDYQHFFDQSNQHERKLPQHYAFFHGQDGIYLILHALQKYLVQLYEKTSAEDFIFLRARNDMITDSQKASRLLQEGCAGDGTPAMRKVLLSVNLSIPGVFITADGKSKISGESTLEYLATHCSHLQGQYPFIIRNYLSQFDDRFKKESDFTINIIAKVIAVMQSLTASQNPDKRQMLLQIFVPKNKVDQCVYLAFAYGPPYTAPIYDTKSSMVALEKVGEHPRIDAWDHATQKYRISTIMHMYRNNPEKLAAVMNRIQARIVVTEDLFAHPEHGVKIFSHHSFDPKAVNVHLQQIAHIAQEIFHTKTQNVGEHSLKELVSLTLALPCSPHIFILNTVKNAVQKNQINGSDAITVIKKTFGPGYPANISSANLFPDELHIATEIMKILAAKNEQQKAIAAIVQNFLTSNDSLAKKWGAWFQTKLKEQQTDLAKS